MFSLSAFLSYVFVSNFTPGPNNIMAMSNGSNFGYKKTFKFVLGVTTGFGIIILLSSYLNLILLNFIPKIKLFVDFVGFVYMAYLAVKILKSKPQSDDTISNNTNTFLIGMAMQFINPKVIIYGITVTSSFIIPYYKTNLSLFLFSIFLALIGFIANSCWTLFGALFQKFLMQYTKLFNTFMALLLIYSAISIIN
ncbi:MULTISPECIES: LysE family transporter [unclassified Clostridium]|uniref:LysE family transporter n=1 Tax=unclassified Clostridium TaxID=2614128 RepID=UPI00052DDD65|nr:MULTISPECIES: LysE family transporter [unclassified Clostridium]KGK90298.1 amino acid transporter LysE [Clostridium sp. HMP27]